jgi:hypothetical protein
MPCAGDFGFDPAFELRAFVIPETTFLASSTYEGFATNDLKLQSIGQTPRILRNRYPRHPIQPGFPNLRQVSQILANDSRQKPAAPDSTAGNNTNRVIFW